VDPPEPELYAGHRARREPAACALGVFGPRAYRIFVPSSLRRAAPEESAREMTRAERGWRRRGAA